MTTSVELRTEVLDRVRRLGPAVHTASSIANHGERRSTAAVWAALEWLWEDGAVEWMGEDRYRLPQAAGVGQMTLGGGA